MDQFVRRASRLDCQSYSELRSSWWQWWWWWWWRWWWWWVKSLCLWWRGVIEAATFTTQNCNICLCLLWKLNQTQPTKIYL